MPLNMNPLRYGQFHVGEDSDFQLVIQRHLQICSEFGLMEFYVEISIHDINMEIENQLSLDYNTQPTPQTDQTLIPSSSHLQIVGTCQPPTEDLGEFLDEDEYEESVPIRMSHQDKEDDNVGEDVIEEELTNFYSQVDVERARSFTGGFGPRNEDVGELYEGMKFPTTAALRMHVKLYHIKKNCTFVVVKSGSNFEDWRCPKFGKECAWRLRATQKVNTYHWEITICPEKHKCFTMTLSQDHPKLDSDMIASFIISMVTLESDVYVASTIERMNTQFNFEVSYKKAWLAKHKAITTVFCNWESSYYKLPRWMAAIQHFLPGTIPFIDAFAYLKPMVQVDGTFLYGKYTQTLLIASWQDVNSNVVPLAFAIVEGETLEAWAWFLKRVRLHVVGGRQNICLISDRHPSILSAVSDPRTMWQPPYGHHVYCICHLASNLNKKYNDSNLKDLFINIDVNSLYVGITIVCQNVFYDADVAQRTIQDFHRNRFSMSLSRQDSMVYPDYGLPCVGVPIVGRKYLPWATVCEGLLGQTPPEALRTSIHFKAHWWGFAVLAYLYRELCNATDPNANDISCCMVLLHLWAWDRFPRLARHEPHFIDPQLNIFGDSPPLGYRWACIDVHYHQRYDTLKKYRLPLDSLKEDQIKWCAYDEDHVSQQIPHYCTDNRHIWRANVPLICFHIVEWQYSNRVLCQFGMDQPILENPVDIDFLHTLKLTGNI
ncbi:uncharacterized protein G2W53_007561 [Senna tora]|uniref:Uncharacterized protein n=1 Tax=Senna tora TaxID=362788 RepID=A0A834X6N9_9FABA|nr:uncharacterized protein G2W53_007561 [Senna tora]